MNKPNTVLVGHVCIDHNKSERANYVAAAVLHAHKIAAQKLRAVITVK